MKTTTPKTLEQRIADILVATDVTSTAVAGLIAEVEDQVSERTRAVELEPAISSSDVSAAEASRTITENEILRSRYRSNLPALQHKLQTAYAKEQAADFEKEYIRVEKLRNDAAEQYAEVPQLMERIIELFQLDEAVSKQCSVVNGNAPAGERRRLVGPELYARGLQGYSQIDKPISKVTTLPALPRTDISAWPRPTSFAHVYAPPSAIDLNTTDQWGLAADARRRAADARVDQELEQLERQKEAFYKGY